MSVLPENRCLLITIAGGPAICNVCLFLAVAPLLDQSTYGHLRLARGVQCHLELLSTKNAEKHSRVIVYPMYGMRNSPLKVNGVRTEQKRKLNGNGRSVAWGRSLEVFLDAYCTGHPGLVSLMFLHPIVLGNI